MKILIMASLLSFLLSGCKSKPSVAGGDLGGKLAKCPGSPNCVVSFYPDDTDHYIEPIRYDGTKEEVIKRLKTYLGSREDVFLAKERQDENYLHYEFKSKLFGFVDDVEFLFTEPQVIHIRSASRVGHSDLGKNRSRIEEIKFKFYQNEF